MWCPATNTCEPFLLSKSLKNTRWHKSRKMAQMALNVSSALTFVKLTDTKIISNTWITTILKNNQTTYHAIGDEFADDFTVNFGERF